MKQYRCDSIGMVFFRHSIPDLYEDYENEYEEFKKGFLEFRTSDMISEGFHKFW